MHSCVQFIKFYILRVQDIQENIYQNMYCQGGRNRNGLDVQATSINNFFCANQNCHVETTFYKFTNKGETKIPSKYSY